MLRGAIADIHLVGTCHMGKQGRLAGTRGVLWFSTP